MESNDHLVALINHLIDTEALKWMPGQDCAAAQHFLGSCAPLQWTRPVTLWYSRFGMEIRKMAATVTLPLGNTYCNRAAYQ